MGFWFDNSNSEPTGTFSKRSTFTAPALSSEAPAKGSRRARSRLANIEHLVQDFTILQAGSLRRAPIAKPMPLVLPVPRIRARRFESETRAALHCRGADHRPRIKG